MPAAFGHTQAGTQVVRVGYAVQHQNQRGCALLGRERGIGGLQLFQQFVQRMLLRQGLHARRHTLVAVAAAQFGQALTVGFDQPHTTLFGALQKLAHAGIAPVGLEMDFDNGGWRGLETHAQGMKAE